jgi:hypothetical protein
VAAAVLVTPPATAAPSGKPYLCSEFATNAASARQGSAVTWTFDSDCVMPEPIPIRLRVSEDGAVVFEEVFAEPNELGRRWGVVDLAAKAPCAWSDVMVEAAYDDGAAFSDSSATRTRVWYDPGDDCGA